MVRPLVVLFQIGFFAVSGIIAASSLAIFSRGALACQNDKTAPFSSLQKACALTQDKNKERRDKTKVKLSPGTNKILFKTFLK